MICIVPPTRVVADRAGLLARIGRQSDETITAGVGDSPVAANDHRRGVFVEGARHGGATIDDRRTETGTFRIDLVDRAVTPHAPVVIDIEDAEFCTFDDRGVGFAAHVTAGRVAVRARRELRKRRHLDRIRRLGHQRNRQVALEGNRAGESRRNENGRKHGDTDEGKLTHFQVLRPHF